MRIFMTIGLAILLSSCDLSNLPSASMLIEESKALGAGCKQLGRALEDCFALNQKAKRNGIMEGWLETDDYMRVNKIEPSPALLVPALPLSPKTPLNEAGPAQEAPVSPKSSAQEDRARWYPKGKFELSPETKQDTIKSE